MVIEHAEIVKNSMRSSMAIKGLLDKRLRHLIFIQWEASIFVYVIGLKERGIYD